MKYQHQNRQIKSQLVTISRLYVSVTVVGSRMLDDSITTTVQLEFC